MKWTRRALRQTGVTLICLCPWTWRIWLNDYSKRWGVSGVRELVSDCNRGGGPVTILFVLKAERLVPRVGCHEGLSGPSIFCRLFRLLSFAQAFLFFLFDDSPRLVWEGSHSLALIDSERPESQSLRLLKVVIFKSFKQWFAWFFFSFWFFFSLRLWFVWHFHQIMCWISLWETPNASSRSIFLFANLSPLRPRSSETTWLHAREQPMELWRGQFHNTSCWEMAGPLFSRPTSLWVKFPAVSTQKKHTSLPGYFFSPPPTANTRVCCDHSIPLSATAGPSLPLSPILSLPSRREDEAVAAQSGSMQLLL